MASDPWAGLQRLKGGLIVSCQAAPGEPLGKPEHIVALALSAIAGGAAGLRLEGAENIACVRQKTDVPIVGLIKSRQVADHDRLREVYITRTFKEAQAVAAAGADIIAVDATGRQRPGGLTLTDLVRRIHGKLGRPVWADVAAADQGVAAADCGADAIATTLYGYTEETERPVDAGPDFELVATLCRTVRVPVILEGRVWHPHEVTKAFELGCHAVVVGSAITRPQLITRRFVKAIPVNREIE